MTVPGDDLPRDAHLQAALRHAPDADASPPPHVSAQILAAAHRAAAMPAAVHAPARSPAGRPWLAWPGWRTQGALATVCVAGLVGLLWRGEQPGPAVEGDRAAPQAAVPAAAPAVAAPASDAALAREADRAAAAPPPAAAPAEPRPGPTGSTRERRLPTAPARNMARDATPLPSLPAVQTLPAPPAPPPPPPSFVPPPEVHVAPPAGTQARAAPRAAPPPPPAPAAAGKSASPSIAHAFAPAAPAAPTRWRIDGEDRGALPPGWLRAVEQLDAQRGQPSPLPSLTDTPRVDLLLPGGQATGSLWIGSELLLWCRPAGCRLSSLDAETAASLLQALQAPKAPR